MATRTSRRSTRPMSYYWDVVKEMDDSQKLELISILIDSMRSTAAKKHEAENEEPPQKPYTMEDINAMIDQSEADIAAGRVYEFDVAIAELEKEFAEEDRELAMAEAISSTSLLFGT